MTNNLETNVPNLPNLPIDPSTNSDSKQIKPHGLRGRPRPPEVRAKISASLLGKPKTNTSYLKGLSGPNHPAYVDGQGGTREYSEEYAAWKQGVLRASGFKCFVTQSSDHLHCHHLVGWWNESTRFEIANGIAISAEVHKTFHDLYGRGNNVTGQFEDFCKTHYNITDFPWQHGNHKPSFTIEQEKDFIRDLLEKNKKDFSLLVQSRGHEIEAGTYQNNQSILKVRCTKHCSGQSVKVGDYKKAKFGLSCCASQKQSEAVAKANTLRKKKETTPEGVVTLE